MDITQLARIIPQHFTDWDNATLLIWLQYIRLPHLVHFFQRLQLQGSDLPFLTQEDLRVTLKVKSAIQRKKLINWIGYLVQNARAYRQLLNIQESIRITHSFMEEAYESQNQLNQTMAFDVYERSTQEKTQIFNEKQLLASTQKESLLRHKTLYIYPKYGGEVRYYTCNGGRNLTIGKAVQNNIVIIDDRIQLNHCSIVHRKGQHYIVPNKKNTQLWVKVKKRIQVDRDFLIEMGITLFQVTVRRSLLQVLVHQNMGPVKTIFSRIFDPRVKPNIKIGRSTNQDLSFTYDSTMSLYHGQFLYYQDSWHYEDLNTTNGSWIKCKGDTLVENKMTFRCGKTVHFFDCRLVDNEDGISVSSVASVGVCKRCGVADKNTVVTPCSHNSCCYECASSSKWCFQCNAKVQKVHKIYRS